MPQLIPTSPRQTNPEKMVPAITHDASKVAPEIKQEQQIISRFVQTRQCDHSMPQLMQMGLQSRGAVDFESFFKHVQQQVWFLDAVIWRRHFQSRQVRKSVHGCSCCGSDQMGKTLKPKDIIQVELERSSQSSKRKRSDKSTSASIPAIQTQPAFLCQTCCSIHQHRNQQLALLHRLCGIAKAKGHAKKARTQ